jgi:hypothetical protein
VFSGLQPVYRDPALETFGRLQSRAFGDSAKDR